MPGARPLRILVISNLYPSHATPAFGTFVAVRVRALERAGQLVDVVAIRDVQPHRRVARKYLRLGLAAVGRAVRAFPRARYDVVEAHIAFPTGLIAWPVAALHGAALVLFVHGTDVSRLVGHSAIRRRLFRALVSRAAVVVVNSRHMRAVTEEALGRTEPRVVIISPGIDLANVRGDPDQERSGILYVGRLAPEKGVATLLDAMTILARRGITAPLLLIGGGEDEARLRALAVTSGLDAAFAGARSPAEVGAAMLRAAVVVVPSLREALGLAALEAMAAGAIVVAARTGGLVETVVDGVTGVTTEPGDPLSLADGIERALAIHDAPAARAAMTTAARQMAAGHSIELTVAESLSLYRRLLSRVTAR